MPINKTPPFGEVYTRPNFVKLETNARYDVSKLKKGYYTLAYTLPRTGETRHVRFRPESGPHHTMGLLICNTKLLTGSDLFNMDLFIDTFDVASGTTVEELIDNEANTIMKESIEKDVPVIEESVQVKADEDSLWKDLKEVAPHLIVGVGLIALSLLSTRFLKRNL